MTTPNIGEIALHTSELTKIYGRGETRVIALNKATLNVEAGTLTAITGPSGSGKSTLLHCMAGLDAPTSGSVVIGKTNITNLKDKALTVFRRDHIGFIFQSFNLIPSLTAKQNIELPAALAKKTIEPGWFNQIVEILAIGDRLTHKPGELSGGQQQRVAIARALMTRPDIIFADEPTGNLDSESSAEVISLLQASVRELGQTIVMVTHDAIIAQQVQRRLTVIDGNVTVS